MLQSYTKSYAMNTLLITIYYFLFSGLSCNKVYSPESLIPLNVFTSLAELRNTNVKENTFYNVSDFGGGKWILDSKDRVSEDNTGTTVITVYGQTVKRITQGFINVKWFGAKGDSVTDETDAFNKALAAAHAQNQNLYIPAGIYSCNKINKYNQILVFDAGSLNNITIYGDGTNSKITSSSKNSTLLFHIYANTKNSNLTIKNIFFESIHPSMVNYSHGLMFLGTANQNFQSLLISNCRFEGFSTTILGQGLNGVEISNDTFNAPLGHDNAQANSSPAVYIWFFDNADGNCSDIRIVNNTANGYSGTKPIGSLFSKRPMDGFIYGTGYGYFISANKTQNFSEEHISIAYPVTFPETTKRIIISENTLEGSIPDGSKNQDGSLHASNYAIRCDASHSNISNNIINNFSVGILVRTFDYPNVQTEDITIMGNTLTSDKNLQNCQISKGISVQGSLKHRLRHVVMEKNIIQVANVRAGTYFSAISLNDTDSSSVITNEINASNLVAKSSKNIVGISYGRVSSILDKDNVIKGITSRNQLNATDEVTIKSNGKQ